MSKSKKELKHKIKMMQVDYKALDEEFDDLHARHIEQYVKGAKIAALALELLKEIAK